MDKNSYCSTLHKKKSMYFLDAMLACVMRNREKIFVWDFGDTIYFRMCNFRKSYPPQKYTRMWLKIKLPSSSLEIYTEKADF